MAFIITVKTSKLERMQALLDEAKERERELWRPIWGNTAFTVNIPNAKTTNIPNAKTTDAGYKDRYIKMVQTHGSVQLSLGAAMLPGYLK